MAAPRAWGGPLGGRTWERLMQTPEAGWGLWAEKSLSGALECGLEGEGGGLWAEVPWAVRPPCPPGWGSLSRVLSQPGSPGPAMGRSAWQRHSQRCTSRPPELHLEVRAELCPSGTGGFSCLHPSPSCPGSSCPQAQGLLWPLGRVLRGTSSELPAVPSGAQQGGGLCHPLAYLATVRCPHAGSRTSSAC